jgi:hypothetical protein
MPVNPNPSITIIVRSRNIVHRGREKQGCHLLGPQLRNVTPNQLSTALLLQLYTIAASCFRSYLSSRTGSGFVTERLGQQFLLPRPYTGHLIYHHYTVDTLIEGEKSQATIISDSDFVQ